jgi:hypothetical protein
MGSIQERLRPLIDLLPESARPYWWAILGSLALLAVLILLAVVRGLFRALFGKRQAPSEDWARRLGEDLSTYPPPAPFVGKRRLTVYHIPVRLQLAVLAPAGTEAEVDVSQVALLLDRVVPGLGNLAAEDHTRVRLWPPQLSQQGFATAFFRLTRTPQAEGRPSRWVLVAGRSLSSQPPYLLGLALLADEPNTLGRIPLEPHQWLDVLRLKEVGE